MLLNHDSASPTTDAGSGADIDFGALSDEELSAKIEAARYGEPAVQEPPAAPPADQPPAQDPVPPAVDTPPQDPVQPPAPPAPPTGPSAEEQERAYRAQLEAMLKDPRMIAQAAAQLGLQVVQPQAQQPQEPPDRDLDPAGYAEWLVARSEERLQGIEQFYAQQRQAEWLSNLRKEWTDLDERVTQFDKEAPHLADQYRPDEKYLLYLGSQWVNPETRKALVEAEAKPLAEQMAKQMVAEALAKQKEPIQGPEGLARAGAVNPGTPTPKRPDQMTDAELEEAAAQARRRLVK